jgi:drug/metabolite transporter (DMT)-like permease
LLGAAVLGDALPTGAWISLLVVAIGLGSLVRPGAPRAEVGFALLTAIVIGGYTVIDTAGSRHSTNGFAYGVVLTMLSGVVLTGALVVRGRAGDAWRSARTDAPRHLVSGLCLATAYSLVLVAVRFAPIGYVATLRESSVVIGALLGWLLLHERLGGRRLVSSVVVTVGLVGLVVLQ